MKLSTKTHKLLRRYLQSQIALNLMLRRPEAEHDQIRRRADADRANFFNHLIGLEKEVNRLRGLACGVLPASG